MDAARRFLRRKFVRDTLALQVGKIGVTVLGLAAWVIVPVALGATQYGVWALAQSLLAVWHTLDFTGLNVGMRTLLAEAVGAARADAIRDLLAMYVKVSVLWGLFSVAALALIGPALAGWLYPAAPSLTTAAALDFGALRAALADDPAQIGRLAALLSLSLLLDPFYNLVLIALQSRRAMGALAAMQIANQLVLTICLVTAALLDPTPLAMVIARLIYSALTLALALAVYLRLRTAHAVPYPPVAAVLRRARTVSYRPYWQFGLMTAIDKNLANLIIQIPLQLTGIHAGLAAAGQLQLALRGIQQTNLLTSALFDNMAAVVPQAVGAGDYARLWRNFSRVLLTLLVGAALFYGAVALAAPLLIVPLFGAEWEPALPLIAILAVYGVASTVGGIFGPLYRAFNQMRSEERRGGQEW